MDRDEENIYTFELKDDDGSTGLPIPPRQTPEIQEHNQNNDLAGQADKTSYLKPFRGSGQKLNGPGKERSEQLKKLYESVVKLNREPMKNSFMMLAEKYENHKAEDARHIPFSCYWPTYEAMTEKQKEWYFYWRDRVRSCQYPDTDLSYIFLHMYELINQVGVKDAADGFVQLCLLWTNYRERYPSLDRYLVPWVQDYIAIYSSSDPFELLSQIPDKDLLNLFPDYAIIKYTNHSEQLMTLELISRFSDYDFINSKFCLADSDNMLLNYTPLAFQYINRYLLNKEHKSIFELYSPYSNEENKRSRLPFQNAVYHGEVKAVRVEHISYVKHRPLRIFFTSIIKYLENKLRQKAGFKGRLRGYILREEMIDVIDSFVKEQLEKDKAEKNKVKIEIDREKILKLIHDSNIIRQKLLENSLDNEDHSGENTITADIDREPENHKEKIPEPSTLQPCHETCQDESEAQHFISGLDADSRAIIGYMAEHGFEASNKALEEAYPGVFLQIVIDNINDRALEELGDIFIMDENGLWTINEDLRDNIIL